MRLIGWLVVGAVLAAGNAAASEAVLVSQAPAPSPVPTATPEPAPTPAPPPAPAAAPAATGEKTSRYGISGGFLLPGDIYVGDPLDVDIGTEMSMMLRGMGDWKVGDKITAGLFATFVSLQVDEDDVGGADVPDQMLEVGGTIRFIVQAAPQIKVRPGVGLGYRTISGGDDIDDIAGMGVNLSVEIEYDRPTGVDPYADVGFITQPNGGNDDVDVTWGPILYLMGGVVF